MEMPSTRVIIVDDHPLMREGIRSVLSGAPHISIVGEGCAGEHVESLVEKLRPDVVILDVRMPQWEDDTADDGELFQAAKTIAKLIKKYPDTRYLVVSEYLDRHLFETLLSVGASGYLLKNDALSMHLPQALRAVRLGGVCVSPGITSLIMQQSNSIPSPDVLSTRLFEILRNAIIYSELDYASIAKISGVSLYTYKNHLANIRSRLGVKTHASMIIRGIQMGVAGIEHISFDYTDQDLDMDE